MTKNLSGLYWPKLDLREITVKIPAQQINFNIAVGNLQR